jgi:rubrerythrin
MSASATTNTSDESSFESSKREKKLTHVETGEDGVTRWFETSFAGKRMCQQNFTEWKEHENVQQCPKCGEFHSAVSPPRCFGCTFGVK